VIQFTVKHSSYINATTSYLIELISLAYYYISAFAATKPDATHTLFDIISIGVNAV